MPHYRRYTDAIKPVQVKKAIDYDPFTWNSFTKLLEDLKTTGGYRTVVFDTAPMLYRSEPLPENITQYTERTLTDEQKAQVRANIDTYRDQPVFGQIIIPEEWRNKE